MFTAILGLVCLGVSPPELVSSVKADYPPQALEQKLTARVVMRLEIDASGNVTNVEVTEAAGNGFDEAAAAALRQFKFKPAMRDDTPVASRILYTYVFEIADEPPPPEPEPQAPPPPQPPPPAPTEPEEVEVRGARVDREVTMRSVTREELRTSAGTNGDALRAVQNFPGVARAPGLTGQLVVRGSAPEDTEGYVDGSYVPYIYHFGGLSSVLPTETLEGIDLYPGNFGAKFGRVTGGVVDIHTRAAGSDDGRYHGMAQIDLIDARALGRGPIAGGWTFIAAARRSWIDAWLSPLLPNGNQAPFYYDGQFFAEKKFNEHSRLKLGAYGSYDELRLKSDAGDGNQVAGGGTADVHQGFWRVQANYDNELSDRVSMKLMASFGIDAPNFSVASMRLQVSLRTMASRSDFTWRVVPALTLSAGYDFRAVEYTADVRFPDSPLPGDGNPPPYATARLHEFKGTGWFVRPAAYVQARLAPIAGLEIVPALRVDYNQQNQNVDIGPRFNARYDVSPLYRRTTLKGAVGMFYMPQTYQYSIPIFGDPNLKSNRALETSAGFEQELTRDLSMSLEGFYKKLDHQLEQTAAANGSFTYGNQGTGRVIGSELLLKYAGDGPWSGSLAYTLSRSTRIDHPGDARRLFEWDQTNVLTMLGAYKAGNGWSFSGRFRYVTGNPYTPCAGGRLDTAAGVYGCVNGPLYSARNPAFSQLDFRVEKQWVYTAWKLSAYVDFINITNRKNSEAVEYNFNFARQGHIYGLPFIPSFGLRGEL